MRLGLDGLKTSDDTESTGMKSSTGAQLEPPLVVFQMPPPTLPAKRVPGFAGWTTIERMRPPTLPGPSQRHDFGVISDAPAADAGARRGKHRRRDRHRRRLLDAARRAAPFQQIDLRFGARVGVGGNASVGVLQLHQLVAQRVGAEGRFVFFLFLLPGLGEEQQLRRHLQQRVHQADGDDEDEETDQVGAHPAPGRRAHRGRAFRKSQARL